MKLFHSWKRWQLIALVCVVLTAVLTLVFVLQGGSGDTQPTGGTEGDAGGRHGAARNSRSHRGAHSRFDGSHRSSD